MKRLSNKEIFDKILPIYKRIYEEITVLHMIFDITYENGWVVFRCNHLKTIRIRLKKFIQWKDELDARRSVSTINNRK